MKAAGVGALAAFSGSLIAGFGRLRAIDDARFKLQGLGHDAATVDAIMESALDSVLGTSFGLGDAATIAASAVAAGVTPGKELTRTLSLTGDAASIAGVSLTDMGSIFGKVAASNRLSMSEVNQMTERGIPILQMLADEYGVTADEAREMVSRGEVDFAGFQNAIEDNIGGAALKAGESFSGSFANMGAAIGRFGAAILGPAFAAAPKIFGDISGVVDRMTERIEPLGQFMSRNARVFRVAAKTILAVLAPIFAQVVVGWVRSAAAAVTSVATQVAASWRNVAGLAAQGVAALRNMPFVIRYYVTLAAQAVASAATHAVAAARVVAGWVLMGAKSLLAAAKMAAAWVIAMGPVGWVIASVAAVVAVIVANWDTVVEWTKKAWSFVTETIGAAWSWVTETTSNAVAAVVGWFAGLPGRIWDALTALPGRLWDAATGALRRFRDGFVETFVSVRTWFEGLPGRIVGFIASLPGRLWGLATRAFGMAQGFFGGIVDRAKAVIQWFKDLPGNIVRWIGDIGSVMWKVGVAAAQGFLNGLTSWAGRIAETVEGVFGKSPGKIAREALAAQSPSRVFMRIGEDVVAGWRVGVERQAGSLVGAMRTLSHRVAVEAAGPAVGVRPAGPALAGAVGAAPAAGGDGVGHLEIVLDLGEGIRQRYRIERTREGHARAVRLGAR